MPAMNLLLHGIEVPSRIRHDNALARPLTSYGPQDRVEVITTDADNARIILGSRCSGSRRW